MDKIVEQLLDSLTGHCYDVSSRLEIDNFTEQYNIVHGITDSPYCRVTITKNCDGKPVTWTTEHINGEKRVYAILRCTDMKHTDRTNGHWLYFTCKKLMESEQDDRYTYIELILTFKDGVDYGF